MLIRSLRAENFMKFRDLELTDIPARGLIGIVGRNEGGKTTIGELIQFALFGKTLSVERGSILDLIHWDRDHCVVEMEFSHEGTYRVWREIDRYGTNYARLLQVDPDDPEKSEEIASGSMPVARELESRLRFSFDDFLRSFYLAERDFPRSPEKMRGFLDRMTGVEVLLSAKESAGGQVGELEERFGQLQAQVRKNEQQIARYVPNVAKIPELEETLARQDEGLGAQKEEQRRAQEEHANIESKLSERDGFGTRLEALGSVPAPRLREEVRALRGMLQGLTDLSDDPSLRGSITDGLEALDRLGEEAEELRALVEKAEGSLAGRLDGDGGDSFRGQRREEEHRLDRARSRRQGRLFLSTLFFLVGSGIATLVVHDAVVPESPWIPTEWGTHANTQVIGGIAAGLSCLLAAVFASLASRQRHEIIDVTGALSRLSMDRDAAGETRDVLAAFRDGYGRAPIATVADPVLSARQEAVSERAKALRARAAEVIDSADPDLFRAMAAAEKRIVSRTKHAAKEARKRVQEISEALKKMQSKRDRTQSEIREYQKQDGRRSELEDKNAQLRKEGSDLREEMDVHHLAQELLGETVDSIRHRAGPNLGKGIRRLLPYLTDDRYQDLQVTPDFELKLFTGAKSDFLATHELSGGTLEGLSFGFRLSFAQAFVGAVTRAPQCLFLDEPFRAMDRGRVRKTLKALHRLSDDLPQIFVVLPDVDLEDRKTFDAIIETEVLSPELCRSLDERSAPAAPVEEPEAPQERERGERAEGEAGPRREHRRDDRVPREEVERARPSRAERSDDDSGREERRARRRERGRDRDGGREKDRGGARGRDRDRDRDRGREKDRDRDRPTGQDRSEERGGATPEDSDAPAAPRTPPQPTVSPEPTASSAKPEASSETPSARGDAAFNRGEYSRTSDLGRRATESSAAASNDGSRSDGPTEELRALEEEIRHRQERSVGGAADASARDRSEPSGGPEPRTLPERPPAPSVTERAGAESRGAGSPGAGSPGAGSPSLGPPSAGSPSAGSPSAGSPSAGSPSAGSPSAGPPRAGSPSAGSPRAESPRAESPRAESPRAESPSAGSPSAGSPSAGSPSAGPPSVGRPEAGSGGGTGSDRPSPSAPGRPERDGARPRTPGRVRNDAAESPSQFLAGIFDEDADRA